MEKLTNGAFVSPTPETDVWTKWAWNRKFNYRRFMLLVTLWNMEQLKSTLLIVWNRIIPLKLKKTHFTRSLWTNDWRKLKLSANFNYKYPDRWQICACHDSLAKSHQNKTKTNIWFIGYTETINATASASGDDHVHFHMQWCMKLLWHKTPSELPAFYAGNPLVIFAFPWQRGQ